MPLSFMRDTVIISRAPFANKNGMEYRDWDNAVNHAVSNAQITAQATSRDFDGRTEQISDRRTLRAKYDADIQAGDHVIYEGDTYEIDGDVYHTKSPTGRVSSTRCTLVRWDG